MTNNEFANLKVGQKFTENSSSNIRYIRAVKVSDTELDVYTCWMNPSEGYPKERKIKEVTSNLLDDLIPVDNFISITNNGHKLVTLDELHI